jgi:hypothetical protein
LNAFRKILFLIRDWNPEDYNLGFALTNDKKYVKKFIEKEVGPFKERENITLF